MKRYSVRAGIHSGLYYVYDELKGQFVWSFKQGSSAGEMADELNGIHDSSAQPAGVPAAVIERMRLQISMAEEQASVGAQKAVARLEAGEEVHAGDLQALVSSRLEFANDLRVLLAALGVSLNV